MGGIRSDKCNQVSNLIWLFGKEKGIRITCTHIPGVNNEADTSYRQFNDRIKRESKGQYLQDICKILPGCDIDLLESKLINKEPVYCS